MQNTSFLHFPLYRWRNRVVMAHLKQVAAPNLVSYIYALKFAFFLNPSCSSMPRNITTIISVFENQLDQSS